MRSASSQISARSTTVIGLEAASWEAADTAEEVGIHQDSSESEADESKSVESLPLKRRRSQHVINTGAKAKIMVHEESDDLGVECNVCDDDDGDNTGNGDDVNVASEEMPDLEECDSYDGAFEDEEDKVIMEDDLDEDGSLLEEDEAVPVEDTVIVSPWETWFSV